MNAILEQAALWTWQNSLAATVLAAAVLAVRRVFGKRVAPVWLCLAGWIVMLRLVLPAPLPNSWAWDRAWAAWQPGAQEERVRRYGSVAATGNASGQSLQELRAELAAAKIAMEGLGAAPSGGSSEQPPKIGTPSFVVAPSGRAAGALPPARPADGFRINWIASAVWTWAAGAAVFLLLACIRHVRFLRRLKATAKPVSPPWPGLAEECAASAGLRRMPEFLTFTGAGTPYLCGLLRPRIVLPSAALASLTHCEARHVLLHEMLHISRRDLAANWLLTAVRALHWFNPIIHLAVRRLLADRELLRDRQAVALLHDPDERNAYGHTLLKLALPLATPAPSPGLAPLFHSEKELKRRLTMIQLPLKSRRLAACMAAVILAAVSAPLFTTARGYDKPASSTASTPPSNIELSPSAAVADKKASDTEAVALAGHRAVLQNLQGEQLISGVYALEGSTTLKKIYPEYQEGMATLAILGKSGFGPRHPKILGLKASVNMMHDQMAAAAESYRDGLAIRIAAAGAGVASDTAKDSEKPGADKNPPSGSVDAGTEATPAEQIKGREKSLEAARTELLDVVKKYHITADLDSKGNAFIRDISGVTESQIKQATAEYSKARENYEIQLRNLDAVRKNQVSQLRAQGADNWDERFRAIAARLREQGKKVEAEVIEQALREVTAGRAAGTAAELEQIRAEMAEVRVTLAALQKARADAAASDVIRMQLDLDQATKAGLGPKHPKMLRLKEALAAMEAQELAADAGSDPGLSKPIPAQDNAEPKRAARKYDALRATKDESAAAKAADDYRLSAQPGEPARKATELLKSDQVADNLPWGVSVPGRKGMVYSPHSPEHAVVDVSEFKKGQTVVCPYTGKSFRVP